MSYETVTLEKRDRVAVIRLLDSRDEKGYIAQLSAELADLCGEIPLDRETWVVVLTGAEDNSFVIEMDLTGAISSRARESARTFWSLGQPIAELHQPVIVAINGDATGLGLELVLAGDIRVAAETSLFGLPHIRTGLIPWDGGIQRLARLVGRGKAMEMILTGNIVDAQEALRIGLINRVVAPVKLMDTVLDIAEEMASKGPIALRYAKEAIYKGVDLTLQQGLRLEADLYLLLHTTRDREEGIKAFREKRSPQFRGE